MKNTTILVSAITAITLAGTSFAAGVKPPSVKFKEAYVSAQEGEKLVFPVVLSKAWNETITVRYEDYTDWGSALDYNSCDDRPRTGGDSYNPDYEEPGLTSRNLKILYFRPGVREQVIQVRTCEDTRREGNETVVLRLISSNHARILQQSGYGYDYSRGTILNDD